MNNFFVQNSIFLLVLATSVSGCIPKKFEVGLSADTLKAVNQLGSSAKDIAGRVADGVESAKDSLLDKAELARSQKITQIQNRIVESIRDYSRSELGTLIINSEEIRSVTDVIETTQAVECYSDQKRYLKYKRIEDQSYDFQLSMVCFDTKSVTLSTDSLTEDTDTVVPGVSVVAIGNVTWSKADGIKIVSQQEAAPTVQTESYPISILRSAQQTMIRVVLVTP